MNSKTAKYPGIPNVIHGNGAVAHVMNHVCGGVIGYPITPSTEIAEIYEAFRADGGVNVWGKHPFFFSPEGELFNLVAGRYSASSTPNFDVLLHAHGGEILNFIGDRNLIS